MCMSEISALIPLAILPCIGSATANAMECVPHPHSTPLPTPQPSCVEGCIDPLGHIAAQPLLKLWHVPSDLTTAPPPPTLPPQGVIGCSAALISVLSTQGASLQKTEGWGKGQDQNNLCQKAAISACLKQQRTKTE